MAAVRTYHPSDPTAPSSAPPDPNAAPHGRRQRACLRRPREAAAGAPAGTGGTVREEITSDILQSSIQGRGRECARARGRGRGRPRARRGVVESPVCVTWQQPPPGCGQCGTHRKPPYLRRRARVGRGGRRWTGRWWRGPRSGHRRWLRPARRGVFAAFPGGPVPGGPVGVRLRAGRRRTVGQDVRRGKRGRPARHPVPSRSRDGEWC